MPKNEFPYRDASLPVDRRVADLLSRMTLEEKVAQMSLLDMKANNLTTEAIDSDEEIRQKSVNGMGGLGRPGNYLSAKETAEWTNAFQKYMRENTRLGIPVFFVDEALHGVMASGSTSFPQVIGLASSWDPELVQRAYTVAGKEMRARGENYALTPVLDLAREPRWGRTEETYGEDPYLGSRMAVAAVRGLQGVPYGQPIDGEHVLSAAKHFAVHGQPESGSNCGPTNYAEREIRENFLQAFRAAVVEAGVGSVMASYNEVNGIPMHANQWLLRDVLRREWGFEGVLISDGQGITLLQTMHRVANSKAEAGKKALEAGIDFELDTCFPSLVEQVRDGIVPETLVDTAVRRVLKAKFLLGLFDNPYVDPDKAEKITNCEAHRQIALQAAHKTLVLLKNDGLLPLDITNLKTLAVIGPNATDLHLGGYSADPGHGLSILEGIRQKVGDKVNVLYAEGCKITANAEDGRGWRGWWKNEAIQPDPVEDARLIAEAVEVARQADVVLLVIGENESLCREGWSENHLGDRDTLDLAGRQDDLLRAVLATGVPAAGLLINGRPLSVNYAAENLNALLEGWYLGQEGGAAFADALFGDVNPGGKLPITIPRTVGQLPIFYNHKPFGRRGYQFGSNGPLFPFGYGLSYTTFTYQNLRVTPAQIKPGGTAIVSVDVTNSGQRAGDEVVQLYIHDLLTNMVTRPVKELKGFRRITLQPGETQTVELALGPEALSYLDEHMQRTVEPGLFDVMVGGSSLDVQTVQLEVVRE